MVEKYQKMKVFVVEDNQWYNDLLEYTLSLNSDTEVEKFYDANSFLSALHKNPAIVTLDYSLPDSSGDKVLKQIKEYNAEIAVVIISAQEDVETALKLLKQGAEDYIIKNEDMKNRLLHIVEKIREKAQLKDEISSLKKEIEHKYKFNKIIIGQSEEIKQVFSLMEKAAQTHIIVSVTGETGTGKELVAKSIHYHSERSKQPFVPINMGAIPKELAESELFGHEKGAFTGASSLRVGKFEEAGKGTIFLDEIAEMDLSLQAKLLRVLQEKEITRIGGNAMIKTNARIIVATNKNLAEEVKKGNFREDLYYRLLGLPIHLPSLRERKNDILILAKHLLDNFCNENKLGKKKISVEAQQKLKIYAFPGNVRELKAMVELAAVMSDADTILADDFNFNSEDFLTNVFDVGLTLKEYNKRIVQHYIKKYNNNISTVAQKLDIGRATIYRMLKS